MAKRIHRSEKDKMVGGVCSGLAKYFDIDVVIIRLLWVLLFFLEGSGLIAYIIAWVIIPSDNSIESGSLEFEDEESRMADEPNSKSNSTVGGSQVVGLILVAMGIFLLAKNYVPYFPWHKLWPLVLIAAGIGIIAYNSRGERK